MTSPIFPSTLSVPLHMMLLCVSVCVCVHVLCACVYPSVYMYGHYHSQYSREAYSVWVRYSQLYYLPSLLYIRGWNTAQCNAESYISRRVLYLMYSTSNAWTINCCFIMTTLLFCQIDILNLSNNQFTFYY